MIHITSSRPSLNIQTPQQDRLPRKRPLEPRRSVSATIASLMSWSITDESSSLLLPKARRRSSEPRSLPHTEMRKDSVMISPTGSLKEEQNYLYSRNDSACSITEPQQRQNVAIITAGPDTWRYEHELESVHNVTTLNIDSRLPLNKRRTPGLPRRRSSLTELHDANYFLIRVPVIMLDDNSADTVRLESAIRFVAKYAQPHAIVILECVVPVGITRRLLEPLISKNTVRCGFCPRVRIQSLKLADLTVHMLIVAFLVDQLPYATRHQICRRP